MPRPCSGLLIVALGLGPGMGMASTGCASTPEMPTGGVTLWSMDSEAEGHPLGYATYTPPGWDGQTPLPLVILLHGGGDDERVLVEHPEVAAELDAWISAGRLPPFILVAPDGEFGFWVNWHDGSHAYQDWVLREVVPEVERTFPVARGRAHRHVIGPSMGGAGTLFMIQAHRERFASATVMSAPIFDADTTVKFLRRIRAFGIPVHKIWGPIDPEKIAQDNTYAQFDDPDDLQGLRLAVVVGTKDRHGIRRLSRDFHDHLVEHEVPHEWIVYQGQHRWTDWAKVIPEALSRQLEPPSGDAG